MNERRCEHSFMLDVAEKTVYIMGGANENGLTLDTTEKWIIGTDSWQTSSTLVRKILGFSAVSAKSEDYVGYIAGGWSGGDWSNEIWGLRRSDDSWVKLTKALRTRRTYFSLLNIPANQVLGCTGF